MSELTKEQINVKIDEAFDQTIEWLNGQSEEALNEEKYEGKWTAAGHIYHLVKSTKGVSSAYKFPKLALGMKFGKNNRQERTYDELLAKYKGALTPKAFASEFAPEEGRKFGKDEIIKRFSDEQRDFKKAFSKWKEKDMSVYVLPHPLIGKLTIREFAFFTILHTWHHLRILKEKYE